MSLSEYRTCGVKTSIIYFMPHGCLLLFVLIKGGKLTGSRLIKDHPFHRLALIDIDNRQVVFDISCFEL